ncbi:nitroreductase family protein [Candidatus Acetothermia bacterium]|nr:nitroreductase family protein [Candidatus Acetothermia bacterium]MBI3643111.1 nitroreductase family protein [Candidatus Acetothermia bacterium]
MNKEAISDYPLHDLIKRRWSPRAFSKKSVEPEKLRSLLEAARWAPSSGNEQPWRFIVTRKDEDEAFELLRACLNEGNQAWAKNVPVLMLSIAKMFRGDDVTRPNRTALYDVGLSVGNLVIQATALGLHVHQMGGFDAQKARQTFQIPAHFEPIAAIAVGYLGDPAQLDEKLREREIAPRERKPLRELIFTEKWGESSSIIEK